MRENRPFQRSGDVAQRHVLVKICLDGNKLIPGIYGNDFPLPIDLGHPVPVTLATNDADVSRFTMSGEFLLAVGEYHLPYDMLMRMIRGSRNHAFHLVAACVCSTIATLISDVRERSPYVSEDNRLRMYCVGGDCFSSSVGR